MSNRTFILCPGQGAQTIGMGREFDDSSAAARQVFDQANEILGFDLRGVCFGGPEAKLNQTDISQPALYTAGIASYRAGIENGGIDPSLITAYAGLSLGEYTALHLAGVFDFAAGLRLVAARGKYMQEAAVETPSSMVAIMGADEAAINALCQENTGDGVLVPANFNAPGQIVISGSTEACNRALAAAEGKGFKAVALKVAGAFHSPLMQSAADRMASELATVPFAPPATTVYSNVTAKPHGDDSESIKRLLVEQIISPVRWDQTMQTLIASGGDGLDISN